MAGFHDTGMTCVDFPCKMFDSPRVRLQQLDLRIWPRHGQRDDLLAMRPLDPPAPGKCGPQADGNCSWIKKNLEIQEPRCKTEKVTQIWDFYGLLIMWLVTMTSHVDFSKTRILTPPFERRCLDVPLFQTQTRSVIQPRQTVQHVSPSEKTDETLTIYNISYICLHYVYTYRHYFHIL